MEPKPKKSTAALQSRPYAKAAFQLAKESSSVVDWEEKLNVLAQLVQFPEIDKMLRDPRLGPDDIKAIMIGVYDKLELGEEQRYFVDELIDAKKLSLAPWIFDSFVKERKKDEGIEDVLVTSATALTAEQQENLAESLRKKFNIQATPVFKTDPDLISGVRIEIGEKVIDQSGRGYRERMKSNARRAGP